MTTPSESSSIPCPSCGASASGKFCSNCGATLASVDCAACGAHLRPGAKFCHRCGTPAGAEGHTQPRSFSGALPWTVAAIALVAFIALIAGQRFSRTPEPAAPQGDANAAPFAGGGNGAPPDISNMSPAERAIRLYNRVMGAHERAQNDTVQMFAPMAIAAYQSLDSLDLDERYDLGRIGAVSGDTALAKAQSDTILAKHPNHLLGLILAGDVARMRKDAASEKSYHDKLVAAAPAERAKNLPEYVTHENDITFALASKAR